MKKIKKLFGALFIGFGLISAFALIAPFVAQASRPAQSAAPRVDVASLATVIGPFTDGYIERVINKAVSDNATAVVFELDTPGGDLSETRKIVERFLDAPLPIIVYVTPSGARAGSAGVFLTYAGNLAVMAPGTNIGAAHPIDSNGDDIPGTLGTKITNDAAAFIRTIAVQRGRNADWGEDAVRNSVAIDEQQAQKIGVVDFIARDVTDVLNQANGRVVKVQGKDVTLNTQNADVHQIDLNLFEELVDFLVNPVLALVFLNIGTIAIIAEIYNPGAVIPAIVGVICLTLAAVSLYSLPTNWAAAILIIAGIGMMLLDIKVTGFALTVGGVIAFLLGAFFLFRPFTPPEPTAPDLSVPPLVIGGLAVLTASFVIFVLGAAIRVRNLPPITGIQTNLGAVGVARTLLNPQGIVFVKSEEWSAIASDPPIQPGETVQVVAVDGLTLRVAKPPKI